MDQIGMIFVILTSINVDGEKETNIISDPLQRYSSVHTGALLMNFNEENMASSSSLHYIGGGPFLMSEA
jgi:hypothetical protein